MGKMPHHGTNGKNDGNPADLDERTVKTVAKMGDYVMGERLVQRETSLSQP